MLATHFLGLAFVLVSYQLRQDAWRVMYMFGRREASRISSTHVGKYSRRWQALRENKGPIPCGPRYITLSRNCCRDQPPVVIFHEAPTIATPTAMLGTN